MWTHMIIRQALYLSVLRAGHHSQTRIRLSQNFEETHKYSSLLVTLLKQQERDDRFLARAEYISEQLKDCDNEAAIQYLEDLTKIFICSYGTKNVLFNVTAADGEAVCRHILEDKVEVNTIVKDGWNRIVPAKIRNNGEKAMDNAGKLADGMKDAIKKAKIDDLVEPIHDHIETEDNSRYNKRTAAYLIGILFWLRVRDFEEGAGEDGSRN